MIELIRYFRILFMSENLSRERLKDFCEDHIQRLTNNNPGGIFTGILTTVTAAYNAYFGDLSSESLNQAVQEGKTVAMQESRVALEKNLSENEKLIAYTYRNNAPVYEEFYPLGMTEYLRADLTTLQTITQRYLTVLTNHAADFTPAFVTEYTTRRTTFVNNRNAQMAAMGDVAAERSDLATTRPALAHRLTENLLTIALQYLGDETKADVYFDQAILNAAFSESARKVADTLDPGQTKHVFVVTQGDVRLIGRNDGLVTLNIGFKDTPDEPATLEDEMLKAGEESSSLSSQAGWTSEKKYLNITNNSDQAGSFVIEKI